MNTNDSTLIGTSPAMVRIRQMAERIALGHAKVLITGESGVGKDLLCRFIHDRSARALRPFIAINCASVTETLLESELFGHVRGSFTGAYRDKIGLLQMAHGGTAFLDEIGEMSLRMQAVLLRFLENGELKPVGYHGAATKVDVRVIAATNRNLSEMVARGQFREDLMYRVAVMRLEVPALRDRREDVPLLVDHFIERHRASLALTIDAMQALEGYHWPGNVRQLQNVLEHLICLHPNQTIDVGDLPREITAKQVGLRAATERRRLVADQLFEELTTGHCTFWGHIYPMFIHREITRGDLTGLVQRGLVATNGNYRAVVALFNLDSKDYKRFHNFISTHKCAPEYRDYRLSAKVFDSKREAEHGHQSRDTRSRVHLSRSEGRSTGAVSGH